MITVIEVLAALALLPFALWGIYQVTSGIIAFFIGLHSGSKIVQKTWIFAVLIGGLLIFDHDQTVSEFFAVALVLYTAWRIAPHWRWW